MRRRDGAVLSDALAFLERESSGLVGQMPYHAHQRTPQSAIRASGSTESRVSVVGIITSTSRGQRQRPMMRIAEHAAARAQDYRAPAGKVLQRDLTGRVLNQAIAFLVECRPLSTSMGNAIKFLKTRVSQIDVALAEDKARAVLLQLLDGYVQVRCYAADSKSMLLQTGSRPCSSSID